ncbi:MAG: hypothetical protein JXD19_04350 [Deltaproteobacteria bacterium]|nr:hypothetical protein [Deltaproteobacteria bacterium]
MEVDEVSLRSDKGRNLRHCITPRFFFREKTVIVSAEHDYGKTGKASSEPPTTAVVDKTGEKGGGMMDRAVFPEKKRGAGGNKLI